MFKAFQPLLFAGLATLATSGAGREDARHLPAKPAAMSVQDNALSVMTYNIKGLPWPLALGRDDALAQIGQRLAAMRREGQQPHIVLLQEAFSAQAIATARRAGYRHVAFGPDSALRSGSRADAADIAYLEKARWDRGERMGKSLDSGLMILSDYPISRIDRMAFPDFACAGIDCMANKGVLIAHLAVPGMGPVSIVNTHLNARTAAMVPVERSQRAFGRQAALMARFIASHVPDGQAMILGGDMNIGSDRLRQGAFFTSFHQSGLPFVAPALEGARQALARSATDRGARPDLLHAVEHGKDWIFARNGDGAPMAVVQAHVPFGSEGAGEPLSDHFGYVVHYQMPVRQTQAPVRFASRDPLPGRAADLR
ncbi:endonuclease/exonuclease/phosphatase family protein [Sphingobium sp. EM0848]|uniref:endonuclease/exonuclease/phosphatase family protein n=1 Tax=Sphingobium sp. EM0848 TaxID=2743473 RepID=UPI00159CB3D0|nr:endonuclease/exonuclease/phosphatase family protein [Sphingobium sp. EM0848]